MDTVPRIFLFGDLGGFTSQRQLSGLRVARVSFSPCFWFPLQLLTGVHHGRSLGCVPGRGPCVCLLVHIHGVAVHVAVGFVSRKPTKAWFPWTESVQNLFRGPRVFRGHEATAMRFVRLGHYLAPALNPHLRSGAQAEAG